MRETYTRKLAERIDAVMCLMLNRSLPRSGEDVIDRLDLERYVAQCRGLGLQQFYAVEPMEEVRVNVRSDTLRWRSPVQSGFPENGTALAKLFLSPDGWSAPTVIFLHALMSASDFGYTRIARRFNRDGWNAIFPHLPFHYSRVPHGHFNGLWRLPRTYRATEKRFGKQ